MLLYKNNQWQISPHIAHFLAHGEPSSKYTDNKQYWIDFINKWHHHTDLSFTDVNPTPEQLARLAEVNAVDIPEGFGHHAGLYVETGFVPADEFGNVPDCFIGFPVSIDGEEEETEPPLTMSATLNKTIITADNTDTLVATVQLKRGEELTTEYDGTTWYVPVLGIDGVQYDLLKFAVTNGEATASWTTSRKGIYTVRVDMIRPKTNLTLPENIEVIVE